MAASPGGADRRPRGSRRSLETAPQLPPDRTSTAGCRRFSLQLDQSSRRDDRWLYLRRRPGARASRTSRCASRINTMANLLASLISSADTLQAYGRVPEATQNNVSSASTPGYAKQSIDLYALPLDAQGGTIGGVRAGALQ